MKEGTVFGVNNQNQTNKNNIDLSRSTKSDEKKEG